MVASFVATVLFFAAPLGGPLAPDERPAGPSEWGFRPRRNHTCAVNPPTFVVRPQKGAEQYEFLIARDRSFKEICSRGTSRWNCFCPQRCLPEGKYYWRFRFKRDGRWSLPGSVRAFSVPSGAVSFPMPSRKELLARVPRGHPRLFLRPEDLPRLRAFAKREGRRAWQRLRADAERILRNPPPAEEPPRYPAGIIRLSDTWRSMWWGNRGKTIRVLGSAATLGFVWRISEERRFAQAGRKLLCAAAQWDPHGSTGYRYNDEAGMPYAYYFSRAYTFLYPVLTDSERELCWRIMKARGEEMFRHLCPRHLWRPFSSHSNRAWHFLGEVGIAFLNEIPEAADWLYFAVTVFFHCYPVWCDDAGGWHEGLAYWRSYLWRFTWWADIMRSALRIDAYQKPFFSQGGFFPMYVQVPGAEGGGFGDLSSAVRSRDTRPLMAVLARQAGNPYWQWYVDVQGGTPQPEGYIGFLRSAAPEVVSRPPSDLPTSRVFPGVGITALNSNLCRARDNVAVLFKSSPFGSQSHGYEAQNSFLVNAFGDRVLIRSGERDIHGSEFHRLWMWQAKSVNTVTFEEITQWPHSAQSRGKIVGFCDRPHLSYVCGEAAEAYGTDRVDSFLRHLVYLKGTALLVWDHVRLRAKRRATFHLHAAAPFQEVEPHRVYDVRRKHGSCRIRFLWPQGPRVAVTDRFDVQPRPYLKLRQWHMRAETQSRNAAYDLLTLVQFYRSDTPPPSEPRVRRSPEGTSVELQREGATWEITVRGAVGGRRPESLLRCRVRREGGPWETELVVTPPSGGER